MDRKASTAMCRDEKLVNELQLEDIVGNEETIKRMKVIAETGNLPHILLAVGT